MQTLSESEEADHLTHEFRDPRSVPNTMAPSKNANKAPFEASSFICFHVSEPRPAAEVKVL